MNVPDSVSYNESVRIKVFRYCFLDFQSAIKRSLLGRIKMKFSPRTGFGLKFGEMYFLIKSMLP